MHKSVQCWFEGVVPITGHKSCALYVRWLVNMSCLRVYQQAVLRRGDSPVHNEPHVRARADSTANLCLKKRLDELDRGSRQLNLIVHSLPEDQEDPLRDIWHMIDEKHRLEMCVDGPPQRLGRCWPDTTKPRPVRLKFGTMHGKHLFLKYAKVLRQAGSRVDDDLTPLQQRERGLLEEDAETLRTKGYHPFYRGSQLHYFHLLTPAEKARQATSGQLMRISSSLSPTRPAIIGC